MTIYLLQILTAKFYIAADLPENVIVCCVSYFQGHVVLFEDN